MKSIFRIVFLIVPLLTVCAQQKFIVQSKDILNHTVYYMTDEKGKVIRYLDSEKYYMCFNEGQPGYFAVFAMDNASGWVAINANEEVLFEVFNTSYGEPSPDELVENKIRIVDEHDKIGYADEKGNIIIKPQFEMASTFYKGKAIIAENCEKIPWDKEQEKHPEGCHHYSLVCNRNGYIDATGAIKLLGDYTFEEIVKMIKWDYPKI